ncbi:MAG TPA: hypothetical protein VFV38_26685 [Ktedonobacteraceae bacterium]|nr:hypothetical protein [Ktedonobacteraceae bacterium]
MNEEQKDLGTLERRAALKGRHKQTSGWFQKVVEKLTENRAKQAQITEGKTQLKIEEAEQKQE